MYISKICFYDIFLGCVQRTQRLRKKKQRDMLLLLFSFYIYVIGLWFLHRGIYKVQCPHPEL